VPAVFPINGIHLLRGAIFVEDSPRANAFHEAAFRATWKDGRNVSDKSIAAEIAQEVGIDPAEFLAGIAAIEVKDKLKNNTAASIARGAFGVPTFFFRDQMFWGQDRLEMLKAAIDKAQRTTVAE
jgi:2-hydroxychromene-2-carboxylate isomerase